ncbi:hypothetical protein M9458_035034, partial [Cirrhinus mrigala]
VITWYVILPVLGIVIWCVWAAHTIPESPHAHKFPLSHSFLPPLLPVSPSAHPQLTICAVGSPQVCQSPLPLWLEDLLSPPLASESWTLPRPVDPTAPPWLLAPSSPPEPVSPPAPPGSIVPLAPPWSVINHMPQDSTPPAAPYSSIPLAPRSGSTTAFQIPNLLPWPSG